MGWVLLVRYVPAPKQSYSSRSYPISQSGWAPLWWTNDTRCTQIAVIKADAAFLRELRSEKLRFGSTFECSIGATYVGLTGD